MAGEHPEDTACRPVEVLDSTVALALTAYRFAASEGEPTERGMRAALSRVAALLAPDSDSEPCPLDHSCDEGDPCGCWCHLHDVAIAECPTYRIVQQQIAAVGKQAARLAAELATARAELARAHSALRGADPWRHWAPGETPCPSCGHPAKTHQDDGCWHAVTVALPGKDVVCPCAAPRAAEPARESSGEHPEAICRFVDGLGGWVVPKVDHDETRPVGPIVRGQWVCRSQGQSDAEHTRFYAAQLLAAADVVEAAQRIQGLADQGRAPNQCKDCGTFGLDGAPPVLHKCQTCGFEGGVELHQHCPGCREKGRPEVSGLLADMLVADDVKGAGIVTTVTVAEVPWKPIDVADLQRTVDAMSAPEATGEQPEAGRG